MNRYFDSTCTEKVNISTVNILHHSNIKAVRTFLQGNWYEVVSVYAELQIALDPGKLA